MTTVDARIMLVVAAIKQSIERGSGPGLSVNRHPNAFFVNVIGEIDLLKAAELVLTRIDEHGASLVAKAEQEAKAAKAAIVPKIGP